MLLNFVIKTDQRELLTERHATTSRTVAIHKVHRAQTLDATPTTLIPVISTQNIDAFALYKLIIQLVVVSDRPTSQRSCSCDGCDLPQTSNNRRYSGPDCFRRRMRRDAVGRRLRTVSEAFSERPTSVIDLGAASPVTVVNVPPLCLLRRTRSRTHCRHSVMYWVHQAPVQGDILATCVGTRGVQKCVLIPVSYHSCVGKRQIFCGF